MTSSSESTWRSTSVGTSQESQVCSCALSSSTAQDTPIDRGTAARLSSAAGNRPSLIRKLGNVFLFHLGDLSRAVLLERLRIQLVSNQPVSQGMADALEEAQALLRQLGSEPLQAHVLMRRLSAEARVELDRLRRACRLRSVEFVDFVRVLDLSGCGSESRYFQRLRLFQEISATVAVDRSSHLLAVCELVRAEAQPEREHSRGLRESDVLAALHVPRRASLFPCPWHPSRLTDPIATADLEALSALIVDSAGTFIIGHGDAGVGKTTTLEQLESRLPPGSVVVGYDCFGGGDYLNMGAQRHTCARALVHLCNEIAVRTGSDLLVRPPASTADLEREFMIRVRQASMIVGQAGGLLVLAVDAADNAVVAAQGDRDCFVFRLWNALPLPDSARIVATSRSHRRASLRYPAGAHEYELVGFDRAASAQNLRRSFPGATDEEAAAFHDRTAGNPRIQFYVLRSSTDLEAALETALRTPRDLFEDLWEAGVGRAANPQEAAHRVAHLLALSRPLRASRFAWSIEQSEEEAASFCRALVPGLQLEDSAIRIRDEDFETYLRDKVGDVELAAAHAEIADKLAPDRDTDEYAARHLIQHLHGAGRLDELVALVVGGDTPTAIEDELDRYQVQRKRLALALSACAEGGRPADTACILLLAAEAARTEHSILEIVRRSPELASVFGEPEAVASVFMDNEDAPWLGAAHLRVAAVLARHQCGESAKEALGLAQAWLRRWSSLSSVERRRWELNASDVGKGAEAVYWLGGWEAARDWLARWRPYEFGLAAAREFASFLGTAVSTAKFEAEISAAELASWETAALTAAYHRAGGELTDGYMASLADSLASSVSSGLRRLQAARSWGMDFLELAASSGVAASSLRTLLNALRPEAPDYAPPQYSRLRRYDPLVRHAALLAAVDGHELELDHVLPDRLRLEPPNAAYRERNQWESDRRDWAGSVGPLLPLYAVRAQALLGQRPDGGDATLRDLLAERTKDFGARWFKGDRGFPIWTRRACELLALWSGDSSELIEEMRSSAARAGGGASLWVDYGRGAPQAQLSA